MAITENSTLLHWNYFLALESDLARLARFVEFTNNNFDTYSIEMAHLFLAAASEVDVVAKQLCSKVDGTVSAENIEQYRGVLCRCLPEITYSVITIPRYGLTLLPWSNWSGNATPDWWRSHNKVKHQRGEYFALANLKSIEPPPNLFVPPLNLATVCGSWDGGIKLFFNDENR